MFIGIYLIMVNDPQILFNDGFYPLLHVVMPEGCAAAAALPGRARLPHARPRAAVRRARRRALQAGAGAEHGGRLRHEPVHALLGLGRERASSSTRWRSSTAASPADRSATAWTATPGGRCSRTSRPSTSRRYYPLRIDGYTTVTDSGGAGLHRGGNGVEKRYVYLEPGEVSIHDDRWLTRPWGVLGGEPGERSEKLLVRADGTRGAAAVEVRQRSWSSRGDMLVYRTAGGGGWKDRLDRPVEAVARDVAFGPRLAREGAERLRRRRSATTARPTSTRPRRSGSASATERGEALDFDFGPPLEEALADCKAETGLEPPTPAKPLRWSPLEPGDEALAPRARGRRRSRQPADR